MTEQEQELKDLLVSLRRAHLASAEGIRRYLDSSTFNKAVVTKIAVTEEQSAEH